MSIRTCRLVLLLFVTLIPIAAGGQDPVSPSTIRELRERLDRLETELQRLKAGKLAPVPADEKNQKILLLLETPYLGATSYGPTASERYLAGRLLVINLTPNEITIPRKQIQLDVDGKTLILDDVPSNLRSRSFRTGNQTLSLGTMTPASELKIRPGGTATTWFVFPDIPGGTAIPDMSLKVTAAKQTYEMDVVDFCGSMLALEVERIGPRKSLGLVSIAGEINSVNVGVLVEALDDLVRSRVVRTVIYWDESAPQLDSQLQSWLQQAAQRAGVADESTPTNQMFPAIPTAIRELHLANLPTDANQSRSNVPDGVAPRIHDDLQDAVAAALESAYERLPIPELLDEIENGHPMTRTAALAIGGGRLPDSELDRLLKFADDDDPRYQKAALMALRHFGDQTAIDKLLFYTRKNAAPLAEVATESLAASRFDAAHQALLAVLKNEPPDSKKNIVRILAAYPRPIWSETIYEFANNPSSEIAVEALTALVRIGHPQLIEVLSASLEQDRNSSLRTTAFKLAVDRNQPETDRIAVAFTLQQLKDDPPTGEMVNLLTRTKDARAIPLLLEHLKKPGSNRSAVINCLAQIGDESVTDMFVENYNTFESHEQSTILNSLRQMKSPRFRELAGKALQSNNSALINTACQGLQADGSAEAVQMLVEALESSGNTSTWSYICNALGQLGTAEARTALNEARDTGNSTKSRYAQNALRSIQQRSPGYQYVYNAKNLEQQEKWAEAIELYDTAIEADDQLPDAFAGRGHARLKLEKYEESLQDFDRAIELDPYNSLAVTGRGLALVFQGKLEAATKTLDDASERFTKDSLFAYNSACVYARALEFVEKQEDVKDRERVESEYRKQAVTALEQSLKLGFSQKDLIKKDPDLNSIRETEQYRRLVGDSEDPKAPPAAPETRTRPKL